MHDLRSLTVRQKHRNNAKSRGVSFLIPANPRFIYRITLAHASTQVWLVRVRRSGIIGPDPGHETYNYHISRALVCGIYPLYGDDIQRSN